MVELIVSPKEFQISEISEFTFGVKIVNQGNEWLEVDISKSAVWINSERSIAWDLAVQNGTIVNMKIAPNHTETISWQMGDAFFENPGSYEILFVLESFSAKELVVVLNS